MCDTITYKQLKSLYLIVFIALNFLTFPSRLADTVKTDGVISIILVSAVAFLSVSATFKIMLSYKGKTFPEVLCELFGKKLGQFVNLIYLINLYVLFVYTLRLINEHIISYVLPEMQPFFADGLLILSHGIVSVKQRFSVDRNLSGIGRFQKIQTTKQCCFAASGRTDNR